MGWIYITNGKTITVRRFPSTIASLSPYQITVIIYTHISCIEQCTQNSKFKYSILL